MSKARRLLLSSDDYYQMEKQPLVSYNGHPNLLIQLKVPYSGSSIPRFDGLYYTIIYLSSIYSHFLNLVRSVGKFPSCRPILGSLHKV